MEKGGGGGCGPSATLPFKFFFLLLFYMHWIKSTK